MAKFEWNNTAKSFDTDNLPKAEYVKSETLDKSRYYIQQGDEFVKIGTKKIPVYEAQEPCLHYEHGGDWTDLYITLPDGEKIDLGEDSGKDRYGRVHKVLQQARQDETAPDGKPFSINV